MEKELSKMKYFLYARRSMEERNGEKVASIDSQIKEMKELAEKQNLNIVKIFSETKSAKEPYQRAQFTQMMQEIKEGKANCVLVWKMDRLLRNSLEEGLVKYFLQNSIIKNIKSSDRDWYPDDNVLMASVEFGMATQYSRDLSKHVKRGLRARLEAGVRPGLAPLGFKNSHYREKGKEEILVDEEKFPLVRKIFDLVLTGHYTPFEAMRTVNEWGLKTRGTSVYPQKHISKTSVYNLFRNTFYAGYFEYPVGSGKWYNGTHQAMITRDEYDRIQYILFKKKGCQKPKTHRFKYTGIIRCGECGAYITAEEKNKVQKNGNHHHYVYYRCTKRIESNCSQKTLSESELEKQIIKYLEKITIPKELHEWALEELKNSQLIVESERNKIISAKKTTLSNCQNKLDALLEMRLAGELTPEAYSEKKLSLEREKAEIKEYLDRPEQKEDEELKAKEEKLSFAEKALREFIKGDDKKKREIFQAIGTGHTLKNREVTIEVDEILTK